MGYLWQCNFWLNFISFQWLKPESGTPSDLAYGNKKFLQNLKMPHLRCFIWKELPFFQIILSTHVQFTGCTSCFAHVLVPSAYSTEVSPCQVRVEQQRSILRFALVAKCRSCLLGGLVYSVCHVRYAGDFDGGKTKRLKRVRLPNLCATAMCCMYDIDKSYSRLYLL